MSVTTRPSPRRASTSARRLTTTTRGSPPAADHPVTSSSHGTGGAVRERARARRSCRAARRRSRGGRPARPSTRRRPGRGIPGRLRLRPTRRAARRATVRRTRGSRRRGAAPPGPARVRATTTGRRRARRARPPARSPGPARGRRRPAVRGGGGGRQRGSPEADSARAPRRDEDRRPQVVDVVRGRRGGEQVGEDSRVGAALDGARGRHEQRHDHVGPRPHQRLGPGHDLQHRRAFCSARPPPAARGEVGRRAQQRTPDLRVEHAVVGQCVGDGRDVHDRGPHDLRVTAARGGRTQHVVDERAVLHHEAAERRRPVEHCGHAPLQRSHAR